MMTAPDLTVFVVDDDEAIRVSLARALRKRGYTVEAHESAAAFLAVHDGSRAGCLILDHGMPRMTGLELQQLLRDRDDPLPIIFITGHGGVPESVRAIKAGAVDFLEKPFRPADLIERIEIAFAMVSERLAARDGDRMTRARFDRLTAREHEIVAHMLADPSGTSSKDVGAKLGISPRTVDHHRARILEKLQIRSVPELIALAQKAFPPAK